MKLHQGKADLFKFLKSHVEDKHVLQCSISKQGAAAEARLSNGLLCHHAYALLKVMTEKLDDGSDVHLVQVSNPHHTGEWKGDWSDPTRRFSIHVCVAIWIALSDAENRSA